MDNWENTEWQSKLRNKPVRYWIRDEIEEIIKEKNINRDRFYEYSKTSYKRITDRFLHTFVDCHNVSNISLSYCRLHFKKELKMLHKINNDFVWTDFLNKLKELTPIMNNDKAYMILSEGWVYEGYIDEIFAVLNETDALLEDFYIVSRKFDWFISYCDDGQCAVVFHL